MAQRIWGWINYYCRKRKPLLKKWFDLVSKSYAPDTAQFITNNQNSFANPVGTTISENLSSLFDDILSGSGLETVKKHLDPIIRIRAVQNFTPSQAVAFVMVFKNIVREELGRDLKGHKNILELLEFESRIDSVSMIAFDVYMECREKIYELKANVEKTKIYKAFKRAGLVSELPDNC